MTGDVFLAYSRSDETEANALKLALKRWGYSVWYDQDILPGVDWRREIVEQYRKSDCIVVLLSESSLNSTYLKMYIKRAIERGNLIAVAIQDRLDDVAISGLLGNVQVFDVSDWRLTRDPKKLNQLLSAVSDFVGRKPEWTRATGRTEFRASRLAIDGNRREGYDIFVSHAEKDRELLFEYVQIFQDFGFSVWWDALISPGENWGFAIDQALENSRCVVVFWTPQSVLSREVYREADYGMTKGTYFPVILQPCKVPPRMSGVQWVDLTRTPPLECERFHRLLDQLKKKVEPGTV